MSQQIKLNVQTRAGQTTALRQQGNVPAVLYGHGVKNQNLQIDNRQFSKIFKQSGYTSLISLNISNEQGEKEQEHTVLIREVQVHPVRNSVLHVDFYQVRMDEVIRVNVPISFTGESIAVEELGGVLLRNIDEVELEALPLDLPHDIEVDISAIKDFATIIHISDLKLPDGVKLLHEPEDVVALVQPPRTEEEIEALDQEVSEDVEGVEGVEDKTAEDEEGEGEGEEKTDETKSDEDSGEAEHSEG